MKKHILLTIILLILGATTLVSCDVSETNTIDSAETDTTSTPEIYVPGVYTSTLLLGGNANAELKITVNKDRISSIDIDMDESVEFLYPLLKPAMQELSAQILEKQSIENISYEKEKQYTSMMLIQAITETLNKAYVFEGTESGTIY